MSAVHKSCLLLAISEDLREGLEVRVGLEHLLVDVIELKEGLDGLVVTNVGGLISLVSDENLGVVALDTADAGELLADGLLVNSVNLLVTDVLGLHPGDYAPKIQLQ